MLDKSLLFLSLPLMLVAAVALPKGISRLRRRTLRVDELANLPLARPGGTPLVLGVLWVVGAAVALPASLALSPLAACAQPAAAGASVPAVGSPARSAILDALRGELGIAGGGSRFKVFHLKTAGAWAYFEGNEIVQLEGRQWQETDLTVKALLHEEGGRWRVRALWTLPGNERLPLHEFERRLAGLRARWQLPAGLFP